MPNNKYIVKIDKESKRLKRIFDDLTIHRECIIKSNSKEWHQPIQQLGRIMSNKNLVEEGFLERMWIDLNRQNNTVEQRLIRLKPEAEIIKTEGNKQIYFKFRRRRLI